MYHGIINVYKEAGFTSHDVVAKLRGICKQKKIGHTGTLDPDAVGVLPVCLGSGTKLCDMLTGETKEYIAGFRLGIATDTQDISGKILEEKEVRVSAEQVKEMLSHFVGELQQVPPMYSALKVGGKKLYELAREGKEVERKARPITIYELELLKAEHPEYADVIEETYIDYTEYVSKHPVDKDKFTTRLKKGQTYVFVIDNIGMQKAVPPYFTTHGSDEQSCLWGGNYLKAYSFDMNIEYRK